MSFHWLHEMLCKHVRSTAQKVCSKTKEQVVAPKQVLGKIISWLLRLLLFFFFFWSFGVCAEVVKCVVMYVLVSARLPVAFVRPAQTRITLFAQLQNSQTAKPFMLTPLLNACEERTEVWYCAATKNKKLNCYNFMNGVFMCILCTENVYWVSSALASLSLPLFQASRFCRFKDSYNFVSLLL